MKSNNKIMPAVAIGVCLVVVMLGYLFISITEKRAESVASQVPAMNLKSQDPRSEKWGKYFPKEYESYKKMKNSDFKSKYNGNKLIDMLEDDPYLVVLWAGYGFSKDYNQPRGHVYAVEDIRNTLRTGGPKDEADGPMPSTCWTCKSPDVPRVMKEKGVEEF